VNVAALVDSTTASALDVAWLALQLEPRSEPGRRAHAGLQPFAPGQESAAEKHAQLVAALAADIESETVDAMRDALRGMPDPAPAIARVAMGDTLDDANLLELLRFFEAVERMHPHVEIAPELRPVTQSLERGRAGKFGFYLSDKYDAALGAARADAQHAQAEYDAARSRLAHRIASELGREEISGTEFIIMRESAATPALPRGVRVVREAPTYFLCELDLDESTLESLRKRDEAAARVAQVEESVRVRITHAIREHLQAIEALVDATAVWDVRLAQIRFAQQFGCVAAKVVTQRQVRFTQGRYLPLQAHLEAQGRRYEPIAIDLRETAVLTGPNMGGKSVALRTCGFIALLVAFGIPVPARDAQCALFDEISWIGIGAQEELGGLLSSFAREVVRLNEILSRGATNALLLIDEFARTTTPHEGKALLVALIRALRRRERLAFIATHLAGIAAEAQARHFAVRGLRNVPKAVPSGDLQAALDSLGDSMDYAVQEVSGGGTRQADAIALAHLLGLDGEIVAEAADLLQSEAGSAWTR
jgi:DNA mismatch repair protein MutS2